MSLELEALLQTLERAELMTPHSGKLILDKISGRDRLKIRRYIVKAFELRSVK